MKIMAEIVFLGTGSSLENLTRRNAGGFILRSIGAQIHFDPGPGATVAAQAFNISTKHTDAIIISKNNTRIHVMVRTKILNLNNNKSEIAIFSKL